MCSNLILLLTPKGTLPSPRWRCYVATITAVPVMLIATLFMATRSAGPAVALDSPLDLGAFTGVPLAAYQAAFAVTMAGAVVAAASLLDRFRRARLRVAHGSARRRLLRRHSHWRHIAPQSSSIAVAVAMTPVASSRRWEHGSGTRST